jgi:hypothetical protein
VTENGCAVAEDDVDEALKDIERAVYLKRYLTEVGCGGKVLAGKPVVWCPALLTMGCLLAADG